MKFDVKNPNMILKRKFFKEYTYQAIDGEKMYHILVLPVTGSSILTINSKYVWDIKYGKQQGARFVTRTTKRLNMQNFMKLENKVVAFRGKPYKIHKYINESEVVDISDEDGIFDVKFAKDLT